MSILSLNTADIFNAIGGGSPLSIINSVINPSYAIRYSSGGVALDVAGVMSIAPSGRASITTAPVEKGKYQAINKVREPNLVRAEVVVSGLTGFSGSIPDILGLSSTSQSDVLATVKEMISTTNTYDIETPKETLEGYDLIDWSYRVTAQSGVTLLRVFLDFQEVIEQLEVQLSGSQSDSKPTSNSISSGVTGVSSESRLGNAKTSPVDELSKSWNNLKKETGQLTGKIGDAVSESFQSATDTASRTAAEVAKSATDKASTLVKSISGAIS